MHVHVLYVLNCATYVAILQRYLAYLLSSNQHNAANTTWQTILNTDKTHYKQANHKRRQPCATKNYIQDVTDQAYVSNVTLKFQY